MANVDQAQAWNGEMGRFWVRMQDRYEAMLDPYLGHLLQATYLTDGENVLDVGCGCGATTLLAAERTSGSVHGVDLSEPMLDVARSRAAAAAATNVTFEQVDAQTHAFAEHGFDLVLSRFGVMFFDEPVEAFRNLARATRNGGRMAFVCWQAMDRNEQRMVPMRALASLVSPPEDAAPPPGFSLADPERVRHVLSSAGWRDIEVAGLHEPLLIGADPHDAAEFTMGQPATRTLLGDADDPTIAAAFDAVREAFTGHATSAGVLLESAAWLVTARRW